MSHCCLCGLLCSLDRAATSSSGLAGEDHSQNFQIAKADHCRRRTIWLEQADANEILRSRTARTLDSTCEAGKPQSTAKQRTESIAAIATLFQPNLRTLIWIDGSDVHTMRAAVELAESTRAAIHVGQSSGAAAAHNVLAGQGWLGSSLAEVASQADLIITLGTGLRSEAPLLAERFIAPALASGRAQWCHIEPRSDSIQQSSTKTLAPHQTFVWPREQWYAQLTHILLALRGEPRAPLDRQNPSHPPLDTLVTMLQNAASTVWLWDAEEFHDAIDELCIGRLLGISRLLSASSRCSLLCLDSQVGRVTAQESLLWLTGCSGTAQFDGQKWVQLDSLAHTRLEQWQQFFDTILLIRSVPSVHPLPSLNASHFVVAMPSLLPDGIEAKRVTQVAAVGIDCEGHLMRGDRATMMYCEAAEFDASQPLLPRNILPTAAALLSHVNDHIRHGAISNAN